MKERGIHMQKCTPGTPRQWTTWTMLPCFSSRSHALLLGNQRIPYPQPQQWSEVIGNNIRVLAKTRTPPMVVSALILTSGWIFAKGWPWERATTVCNITVPSWGAEEWSSVSCCSSGLHQKASLTRSCSGLCCSRGKYCLSRALLLDYLKQWG